MSDFEVASDWESASPGKETSFPNLKQGTSGVQWRAQHPSLSTSHSQGLRRVLCCCRRVALVVAVVVVVVAVVVGIPRRRAYFAVLVRLKDNTLISSVHFHRLPESDRGDVAALPLAGLFFRGPTSPVCG
jgi:hypothetical protein